MKNSRATLLVAIAVSAVGVNVAAQAPPKYQGNCTDAGCHNTYGTKAVVHDPIAQDACDVCHEEADAARHKFGFTEGGVELCQQCHDEPEGKVRHDPVSGGECTACHDPHASAHRNLLVAGSEAELCGECHDEVAEGLKYVHGPVAAGACTVCHDSHASDHPAMLVGSDRAVCESCHEPMRDRITDKQIKHSPVTEGCLTCHNPHGADNKMNLTAEAPELCLDCHDDIGDTIDDASVTHDAVTTGRACASCHDPHASDVQVLLSAEPMELCLSCHDKSLASRDAKLTDLKTLLTENTNHHGPIQENNCSSCHRVHGGSHFRLLTEAYPADFYAPFEEKRYALCFDCHEPDLLADAETEKLTNFRNGKQNLHYVHVHRTPKGRTCRACHNTHASRRPRHITESVPFGSWDLPINFEKTETGGSCQPGCHRAYRYDRVAAVTNVG
jgi:predicted CXXCH cytochrome family protein